MSNAKFDISRIREELQQIIIRVMGDGLRSIPDDIPILDLGISSLALVEGMRQVYDRFGVLVSIRRVIEGQITIGTLALYIEQELNQQSLKKRNQGAAQWKAERTIPVAPSQQHLTFLSRYSNEASAAFNEALILRLRGSLHGPAIHAAIEEVGSRFESLRTALSTDGDALIIGGGEALELVVSPVSADQFKERLTEIVSRPFEVGRRLFRAELLRLSETEHILALVGHSLIIDQQSLMLLSNDIAELYGRFSRDEQSAVAPPTLQWTDYLSMGETAEAKQAQQLSEKYWKDAFDSDVPRLELPADQTRPAVKKYTGLRVDLKLDLAIYERLQALAASENIQPETILLAAFTIFLHRLADTKDLIVGIQSEPLYPDAGLRVITQTHNTLALHTTYEPNQSFKATIHTVAQSLADANNHRHYSFAELVQLLRVPRDQSRSPLFTAAFRSWIQSSAPEFESLQTAFSIPPSTGARYDVELNAITSGNEIQLVCDFSAELFEADTISRWLDGVAALLNASLQDINQLCNQLPMMPTQEREKILVEWNKTEASLPREQTAFDLIIDQAKIHPEQTAIRFGDSSLNYQQLLERVDSIAQMLHQRGVKKSDRVGILVKRSLDLIPSILAAWRVGAIYVPMDVSFPQKRISYMLADSEASAVIINKEWIDRLGEEYRPFALSIEDVNEKGTLPDSISSARGNESAYIIYTSGSTGRPKGVEVRHNALVNALLSTKDYVEFTSQSLMLALTTASFDISTAELIMPLMAAGCVEIGEEGLTADGLQLAGRLDSSKPSHVQATPSTFKSLLTASWQGDPALCLISAGEALSRDLAEQLLPKCRLLWNLYGPTETTVYSLAHRVESEPDTAMRIGHPFSNTQIYILDSQLQPVPIGAIGELYIAGVGVAAGYWQRPELTSERFISNPFRSGERMYRTGDLARYLPNGDVICLGRVDDQVKIHGVRIELGEIESALRSIRGVRDAVATSWMDARGDKQLVAHVIADENGVPAAYNLRTQLREQLPEVMIPPYILFTNAFPHTANGKVHRAGLPSPEESNRSFAGQNREVPSTPTEQTLAKVWATILGIDASHIGRDSDFMDLGGHSLLITLLMVEVRKLFEISFNLREFFAAPTLRKFAALIDGRKEKSDDLRHSASARTAEWARQRMAYLQREAQLPSYIAPARGLVYKPSTEVRSVLITGATGFLGCYIIAEILRTTKADLYCLVRPKRGENGKERIEKQMKRYEVWAEDEAWQSGWKNHLHIVDGDVTLPRLGMKDSDYEKLAREVDAIIHGAAHVNFIYPYEALRATNVLGIHEIIQFAFYWRIKPVHYLSTAAIWPMGAQNTYHERDPIDHYGLLNLGYDESKWVGEKCLLLAEERGLPVARYRPGEVGGDSVTGHCVTDHFVIACFKGFLQFGAFPALDIEVDVAPVDYVAKALVYLAFQRNPLGHAYHLTNPTRRRLSDGLAYLRGLGYQFEELPFEELRDRLVNSRDFASNALFAYQAALEEMDNVSMQLPTYDTRDTQHELSGSGIACASADEKLFGTYLRYLQTTGFIPQPEALLTRINYRSGVKI